MRGSLVGVPRWGSLEAASGNDISRRRSNDPRLIRGRPGSSGVSQSRWCLSEVQPLRNSTEPLSCLEQLSALFPQLELLYLPTGGFGVIDRPENILRYYCKVSFVDLSKGYWSENQPR